MSVFARDFLKSHPKPYLRERERKKKRARRPRFWAYPILTLEFYIWRQFGRPSTDWSLIP